VKIALFNQTMMLGGVQRWVANLTRGFVDKGYDVDLVLVRAVGELLAEIDPRVNVIDLKAKRMLFSLPRLIGYINQYQPSILLTAQPYINTLGLWAQKLSKHKPKVVICEQVRLKRFVLDEEIFTKNVRVYLARPFYHWASAVVAVSAGVAEDLAKIVNISRSKLAIIHNPVVDETIKERALQPVQLPWNEREKFHLVLAAGRLEDQKDFPTLIKAFSMMAKRKNARLMILGDGTRRKQLEQLIQQLELGDLVALPGFTSNPYAYMNRADIFVLSSRFEGFGNVLAEAMALGTPVVSTDCPHGPREILNDGEYGALVPVGDPRALANAIIQTLNRPVDSQRLKERSNEFTINTVSEKYIQLFSKLVRHTY